MIQYRNYVIEKQLRLKFKKVEQLALNIKKPKDILYIKKGIDDLYVLLDNYGSRNKPKYMSLYLDINTKISIITDNILRKEIIGE